MPANKVWILPLLFCCVATSAAAQKIVKDTSTGDWNRVFAKIEIEAGTNLQDWSSYMRKSTVLPLSVSKTIPAGTYNVLISFIVNVDGAVYDIKADNDPGYGLASRAVKIFKGYKGKWRAAVQCGRLVKSYKKEPVIFVISE